MRLPSQLSSSALGFVFLIGLSGCEFTVQPWERTARPTDGLKVKFPEGLKVCKSLNMGYYTYNGFSASLSPNPQPCNSNKVEVPFAGHMGIWIAKDALTSPWRSLCLPYAHAPDLHQELPALNFEDRQTFSCATRPGFIQFWVMTEAEKPTGARVTYIASLTTNDENLKADLISFRQLLSGIELSFPPPSAEVATTLGTLDDLMKERYPDGRSPEKQDKGLPLQSGL